MGQSRSESLVDELRKQRYDGSESLKRSVLSPERIAHRNPLTYKDHGQPVLLASKPYQEPSEMVPQGLGFSVRY